jgi:hypothetical protein
MKKVFTVIAISLILINLFLIINWISLHNKQDIFYFSNLILLGIFSILEKIVSLKKYLILQYILIFLYTITYLSVLIYILEIKNFIITLSLIPIIISIVLLGYLIKNRTVNLKAISLVGLMTFAGIAFVIFIFFILTRHINLSDVISSSLGVIFPLLILIISTAKKDGIFSAGNILPNIRSFNFPTKALLLYVGVMDFIIFAADVFRLLQ